MKNEALDNILDCLTDRNLGKAIVAADIFLSVHPNQINLDRLNAIRTDYQRMTDYWRRGFKDPQLEHLYDNMLKRMYVLYATIAGNYEVRHSPFLQSLADRARMTPRDWSPQVVKESLEAYVSDVALLGLGAAGAKAEEVYARHHKEMIELFDFILTSGVWSDGYATAMEEIVLSPTVDSFDQQLILSSVMLANMNVFDMAKFRMMVHVYSQATDEQVRQRALIGWVLSLNVDMNSDIALLVYTEAVELVEKLLEDEDCCRELVELQKQLIYCINAERDNAKIQNEILPDLMKNQGFRMTRNGIVEEEEDELNDILHPDEAEEKLERVEQAYQKMLDMQKQGSDVYFSGFSRMKVFPFFNEIVNWFVPFYIDHPEISQTLGTIKKSRFLSGLLKSGPFCNSDKYSFLLAFNQVMNQIPQNLREMMDKGEAIFEEVAPEVADQPAYIRRRYLQDLYRFFRLFRQREAFRNPFDQESPDYLFLSSSVYRSTHIEPFFNEVTAFLIKKSHYKEARYMLNNYSENREDFQYYMMAAHIGMDPLGNYAKAVELKPDNERAMAGYARALFDQAEYQKSLEAYDKLLTLQPDKRSYLLNRAVCLIKLDRYDEAEKMLFRLNYERPDDTNVNRVLAWALTCNGKYEQADKIYTQLMSEGDSSTDDLLNYGLCLWFSGHVDDAADCFHRYLKESGEKKERFFNQERWLIHAKGITEAEIQMMLYIL